VASASATKPSAWITDAGVRCDPCDLTSAYITREVTFGATELFDSSAHRHLDRSDLASVEVRLAVSLRGVDERPISSDSLTGIDNIHQQPVLLKGLRLLEINLWS